MAAFARSVAGRELIAQMNGEVAVIRRPAVSAFGQTGHWSGHRRRTAFDPEPT
jgi:hypothetical protein